MSTDRFHVPEWEPYKASQKVLYFARKLTGEDSRATQEARARHNERALDLIEALKTRS